MTQQQPYTSYLFALLLLIFSDFGEAQAIEEESPERQNNITCFAAKKQWVCAPSGEEEKAQEKARQLALLPDEPEPEDEAVIIEKLEPVNISQQVQEVGRIQSIEDAIKDFTPRDKDSDEETPTIVATEQQSSTQTAVNETSEHDTNSETVTQQSNPKNTHQEVVRFQTAPNDFNHWKQQFAEQWTFQVVGTSNRHHLDNFILKNGLENQNYTIVKTERNGTDWWVVLVGLYQSKNQAKNQQSSLPNGLGNNAWVRQIKNINGQAD